MPEPIPWPSPGDYSAAIQNPQNCFDEPILKRGAPETNKLGLPVGVPGQFAVVYAVKTTASKYAVRCFIRPVVDQQQRYEQLSNHLEGFRTHALVDFTYLPNGIRVKGSRYPVVRMAWVAGLQISAFIERHLSDAGTLHSLAKDWRGIVAALSGAHTAHGDLQHGNVLVDEHKSIKLVDYDGFYIPKLQGRPPGEVGHANYQHPERILCGHYEENTDSFSALVIYLSLLALASDQALWRFHTGENLIFLSEDFRNPGRTDIWVCLKNSLDPEVRRLSAALQEHCQNPVRSLPDLESVIQCVPPRMRTGTQAPVSPNQPVRAETVHRAAPIIVKFKNGQAASVAELVDLCDRCWDEASDYLFNGWLSDRLAEVGEAPLALYARKVVSLFPKQQRRGLEMFVREACKAIGRSPVPQLTSQPPSLDAGKLPIGAQKQYRFTLRNQGRGYAWGRIDVQPSLDWIVCSPEFEGSSAHVDLQIDLTNVAPGIYKTQLVLQTEGIPTVLKVPVAMEVVPISLQVQPPALEFGLLAFGATSNAQVRVNTTPPGGRVVGNATIDPQVPGVECDPRVDGASPDVRITVDTKSLEAGRNYSTCLRLDTNAGRTEIPVRFTTTMDSEIVWKWTVTWALGVAATLAAGRAFVAATGPAFETWFLSYSHAPEALWIGGLIGAGIGGSLFVYIRNRRRTKKG